MKTNNLFFRKTVINFISGYNLFFLSLSNPIICPIQIPRYVLLLFICIILEIVNP